jgi:hypothetical protein
VRRIAPVALCLALAAAGCGGGSSSGDKRAITDRVEGFYDAFSAKDAGRICSSLTPAQRRKITQNRGRRGPKNCSQAVGFAFLLIGNALKGAKDAKVTDVQIKGDRARATVALKGRKGGLGLSKEGEQWLISDFDLRRL